VSVFGSRGCSIWMVIVMALNVVRMLDTGALNGGICILGFGNDGMVVYE
jgi:hypothetical protein